MSKLNLSFLLSILAVTTQSAFAQNWAVSFAPYPWTNCVMVQLDIGTNTAVRNEQRLMSSAQLQQHLFLHAEEMVLWQLETSNILETAKAKRKMNLATAERLSKQSESRVKSAMLELSDANDLWTSLSDAQKMNLIRKQAQLLILLSEELQEMKLRKEQEKYGVDK